RLDRDDGGYLSPPPLCASKRNCVGRLTLQTNGGGGFAVTPRPRVAVEDRPAPPGVRDRIFSLGKFAGLPRGFLLAHARSAAQLARLLVVLMSAEFLLHAAAFDELLEAPERQTDGRADPGRLRRRAATWRGGQVARPGAGTLGGAQGNDQQMGSRVAPGRRHCRRNRLTRSTDEARGNGRTAIALSILRQVP